MQEAFTAIHIAILVGLLEIVKMSSINPKFIPVISLILGIASGLVFFGGSLQENLLAGIIIGLSAVGLYSGSTNVYEGIKGK